MRYFWGVLAIILVGIVAIVLLVGNKPQTSVPSGKAGDLTNFDTDSASLRLTIDGAENGGDQHRAIRITIDKHTRQLAILAGYEGQVSSQQVFDNQDEAFTVFLRALQNAGFTKAKNTTPNDERGVCPTGKRYIYELIDSGKTTQRTWNTSCSGGRGSFSGNSIMVHDLFQMQIPDYNKLTNGVNLEAQL